MLGENMLLGASRGAGQVFVAYQGYIPTGDTEFLYQPELILADRFLRPLWRRDLDWRPGIPDCDADGNVYYVQGTDVVKANIDGVEQWRYTGHSTQANCVTVDADGYVYSGASEGWVARTDSSGSEIYRTQVNVAVSDPTFNIRHVHAKSGGICYAQSRDPNHGYVHRISASGLEDAVSLRFSGALGLAVSVDGAVWANGREPHKFDLNLNLIWAKNFEEEGSPVGLYATAAADGLIYMDELRIAGRRIITFDDDTTSAEDEYVSVIGNFGNGSNFEIDFARSDFYRARKFSNNPQGPMVSRLNLDGGGGSEDGAYTSNTFEKVEGTFRVAPVPGRYVNAGMP